MSGPVLEKLCASGCVILAALSITRGAESLPVSDLSGFNFPAVSSSNGATQNWTLESCFPLSLTDCDPREALSYLSENAGFMVMPSSSGTTQLDTTFAETSFSALSLGLFNAAPQTASPRAMPKVVSVADEHGNNLILRIPSGSPPYHRRPRGQA